MNFSKKTCLLVTLFTVCISSAVYSEQGGKSKFNLQFEESEKVGNIAIKRGLSLSERPSFVAEIYFKCPIDPSLGRGSDIYNAILQSSLPAEERDSIARRIASGNIGSFRSEPNGVTVFSLYGSSKKDIKVTAEALIECMDESARKKLEEKKNQLEQLRSQKSDLEQKIAELAKENENVIAELEKMRKMVRYQDAEDTQKSIQEFDKVLQLIEIEITGIQAKLDMIKQQTEKSQKEEGKYPKAASELLFQMRLAQEVELAGALARKNAGESALNRATAFLSLVKRGKEIKETLGEDQRQLESIQLEIPRLEKMLAEPSIDMRRVELADNKIVIYHITSEDKQK